MVTLFGKMAEYSNEGGAWGAWEDNKNLAIIYQVGFPLVICKILNLLRFSMLVLAVFSVDDICVGAIVGAVIVPIKLVMDVVYKHIDGQQEEMPSSSRIHPSELGVPLSDSQESSRS